ncbi:hypothetical protein JW911_04665 [Candidatus Peregrinibacteria bacterium]|nr:hypothetical protein [Candidatus Peregrinibacteria bacterium]
MDPDSSEPPSSAPENAKSLEEPFRRMRDAVFVKKPIFKEIFEERGHKNLYEYAKDYLDINRQNIVSDRQDEFLCVFKEMVTDLLGAGIAESAAKQLKKHYFVSTAEHHGPVCNPFLLNANLLASLYCFNNYETDLNNVIVLSCSNISLNNFMFPRGLSYTSYTNGFPRLNRLSFLPSNSHACSVYGFRPYQKREIEKIKLVVKDQLNKKEITHSVADKLNEVIDEVYNRQDVFDCKTYNEQITKTNYNLWNKFFSKSNLRPSNLIYIDQESVVKELLIKHHLHSNSVLNHILFDSTYDELIQKYFDGITGAFSKKNNYGTYLFWGVSKDKNFRVQLWKKDGALVSSNNEVFIELNPDSIKRALEEKRIIPSLLMVFLTLNLYYGIKCLGAFNQVNYLTFMKNGYIKMMTDRGNYRSIEVCARAQTKELIGDLHLAFLDTSDGKMLQANGLDIILYGDENTWPAIFESAKQITLKEALSVSMPENYKIVYPETERDSCLAAITPEQITKMLHLDKKIKACIHI